MTPNELLLELQEDHYKNYITTEEFKKEREIVYEETKSRLLKKYQEEATPEEIKQYEKELDKHNEELKKIGLPTKFEDPETYSQLLLLSSIIQSGISTSHC